MCSHTVKYMKSFAMKKIKSFISVLLLASMVLPMAGCLKKFDNPMGPKALEKYAKEYGAESYSSGRKFAEFYKDAYVDAGQLSEGVYIRTDRKDAQQAIECSEGIPINYSENIEDATVFAVGDMTNRKFNECFCVSMVFDTVDAADFYYDLSVNEYYVHNDSDVIDANDFDVRMVFDIYQTDQQVEMARQALIQELKGYGADSEMIDQWLEVFDMMYDVDHDLVRESFEDENGLKYTLLTGSHGNVFYTAGIYYKKRTVRYVYGFGYDEDEVNTYIDGVCEYMGLTPPSSL